ncbi:MAG TPA: hypothetical protein VI729_02095 [Anaerolineales bacterium]|nr:hypothetical protein [Anaerolineales bacterium]
MFDDLRERSSEETFAQAGIPFEKPAAAPERKIFGMSAGQRLVLSILLFATVFLLGLSCLLVTNKVWPT